VLDDSLSAVDADTERAISMGSDRGDARRTVILITHRLSTLSGVDRVVVLEHGRVVEDGTHDELVERDGHVSRAVRA
jgi:ABC-type multidrug transport system fused ATPase/permease subunit